MATPTAPRAQPMLIGALVAFVLAFVFLFVGIYTPGTVVIWLSIASSLTVIPLFVIGTIRLVRSDRGSGVLPPPPPAL